MPPEEIFLFSEKEIDLLKGELYYLMAPYLKEGIYSEDEIVEKLQGQALPKDLYYALECLKKENYLQEEISPFSKEMSAFCHVTKISPTAIKEKLDTAKVFIENFTSVSLDPLLTNLKELGVSLIDRPETANLCVLLTTDYLDLRFKQWNEQMIPWIPAKIVGNVIWMGPLFEKGKKGCWECLAHRLRENRVEESYVNYHKNSKTPLSIPVAQLKTTDSLGAHLLGLEIFKWIALEECFQLREKILSCDILNLKVQQHSLTHFPDCLVCGKKKGKKLKPLKLHSHKKENKEDGNYRCFSSEHTLDKLSAYISPLLGVVHSLFPIPIFDKKNLKSVHVYITNHNFAILNKEKELDYKSLRSSSSGKGKTEVQAKVSCLCEAMERYCGIYRGHEISKVATFKELNKNAISLAECLLFSEKQYQNRKTTNQNAYSFHHVPEPFTENLPLAWTPVWSLTHQAHKYIPTAYCYYGYEEKTRTCSADSNGNATGNTLEEAILHGFFELVERDCVAIWWYNRIQRPGVHLKSFQDPFFIEIAAEYAKRHREVWVLDITNDLNIPSFAACSRRIDQKQEEIFMGFGAHFDPKIAIERALSEMTQVLALNQNLKSLDRAATKDSRYYMHLQWLEQASCANQPYLQPIKISKYKTASDYINRGTADLLTDIRLCQEIVESKGMEMLVLDQTRSDIGLPTVKVIVPGLRHFWNRFAPGRLYDVPAQLGWVKKPLKETELNPLFMFL